MDAALSPGMNPDAKAVFKCRREVHRRPGRAGVARPEHPGQATEANDGGVDVAALADRKFDVRDRVVAILEEKGVDGRIGHLAPGRAEIVASVKPACASGTLGED